MMKKLAVTGLIAGALVLSAPAVASAAPLDTTPASSAPYTEPPKVTVDTPVVDVCESSTIVFGPEYFQPGENVGVGISGSNATEASYSGNVANGDGGMVLSFRPPADGDGAYDIVVSGSRSYTATVTVSRGHDSSVMCEHDPGVAPASTELPLTGGIELALTGGGVSPWVVGGGVAAMAAGGLLVASAVARRRARS